MVKTVLKVPFGKGYKILKYGNLIERGVLAKRYPLCATATEAEILLAIESLSMRQVESQLRNYVSEGNRIGGDAFVPSLSSFATIVDDNVEEDDDETEDQTDDQPEPARQHVTPAEAADEISGMVSDVEVPEDDLGVEAFGGYAEAAADEEKSTVHDAIAERDAAAEEVVFTCDHPGCDFTAKTAKGLAIHKTKSHTAPDEEELDDQIEEIFTAPTTDIDDELEDDELETEVETSVDDEIEEDEDFLNDLGLSI